jgi:hypothetical protein
MKKTATFTRSLRSKIKPMFPLFNKKKNDDPNHSGLPEDKKSSLDNLQSDLTVLDKKDMVKLEGGKTGSRSFTDMLGWTSSLGGTIPQ